MGSNKKAIIIGAGFSGLTSASVLASHGWDVTILEKNHQVGGRASVLERDGFVFDKGPSWYWMPDVMESFFKRMGYSTQDFFELVRLDPSYQVIFGADEVVSMSADLEKVKNIFEQYESGSAKSLDRFLKNAENNYKMGMDHFVYKPSLKWSEFFKWDIIKTSFRINLLSSYSKYVRKYFKNEHLIQLLEFPILFLGAMPHKIPALYNMMNHADFVLGTWYPMGGMHQLSKAMAQIAKNKGINISLGEEVQQIKIENGVAKSVLTQKGEYTCDIVISAADYHHTDQHLIPKHLSNYTPEYWDKRLLAPTCLLYFVGIDKKISGLEHHNLFFEDNFDRHARAIYETVSLPEQPLFYVCCPSKTDESVAPAGKENLFILIPIAPGLEVTEEDKKRYFEETIGRLEQHCKTSIKEHVISYTDYSGKNFTQEYHAYKGNAYGLANTLMQTAVLKPAIKNKNISNLYYTGQLTVPGPGVPPAIISGQVVADYILQHH